MTACGRLRRAALQVYSAWDWCVHGARLDVVVDAVLLGAVVPEHLVRVRVRARARLRVRG